MGKIKILVRGLISCCIFSMILFLSAGSINYLQGWIFFATNIVTTLIYFFAYPKDNELIDERSKIKEDAKSWDKILLGVSSLVYLVTIVVAGLDSGRFHWSPELTWPVYALGIVLLITGQVIFITALRENKFFSSIVRIQKERGHVVCDTGIYKIVRHPGYTGMIISLMGIPFITGSLWSLIPTVLAVILLIIRTALEDKTLKTELEGYTEYTKKTPSKLIPGIW
jgi:protein-S-isoprenylcysteine O-methyltransferase Ste14